MKKTLLIAVAALAAGITSIQAQAVYSQNIVGYYNITIPAGKFVLAASQLNLDNTNSINNIFSGLASDANGSTNTAIWLWNPGTQQYSSYKYYLGPDADNYFLNSGSANGFYDAGGTLVTQNLGVGQAAFLQNLAPSSITVTVTGGVPTGTNLITLGENFTLVASPVPVGQDITSTNIGFAGTSDSNGATNDVCWTWNSGTQQYAAYKYFIGADADNYFLNSGSVNGFYDSGGTLISVAPPVGNGFFIQHSGPAETWTNIFKVN